MACVGEALDKYTSIILLSRAIIAEGIVDKETRKRRVLKLEKVKPPFADVNLGLAWISYQLKKGGRA